MEQDIMSKPNHQIQHGLYETLKKVNNNLDNAKNNTRMKETDYPIQ